MDSMQGIEVLPREDGSKDTRFRFNIQLADVKRLFEFYTGFFVSLCMIFLDSPLGCQTMWLVHL